MKKCSAAFVWICAKTVLLVLFYFTFSISLTFYNKGVVSKFKYPLVMTYIHLVLKFIVASLVRNILECKNKKERVYLSWTVYLTRLAPVGITSVLDIALSNWSMEFVTITLYTMTKTSAIIFLLCFAVILKVEKFRWLQVIIVLCISVGLFLFTFQSTKFVLKGFLMCLAASALSGLRWVLTQKVAQKSELGLGNPVDFMYHVQPWMICGLLPVLLPSEGMKFSEDGDFGDYHDAHLIAMNMAVLVGGAILAFFLEFSEFLLVAQTSSLTLSISGVIKECFTLILDALIHHNRMSKVNAVGFIACLMGIILHIYLKATKVQNEMPDNGGGGTNTLLQEETIALVGSEDEEPDDETVLLDTQALRLRESSAQTFV